MLSQYRYYAFSSDDEVKNWKTTENKEVMNSTLNETELTPFKIHAVLGHMKVAHGKRKLPQVNNEVSKRLVTILNVQKSELESTDNSIEVDSEQDMSKKANVLKLVSAFFLSKNFFSRNDNPSKIMKNHFCFT